MKSIKEIFEMMCDEMPYNSAFTYTKPYIVEALKIAQMEGYQQGIDDAKEIIIKSNLKK